MYNSLKPWVNLPAIRKPFISRTGTGTKVFGDDISFLCYAEGKVQVVKNSAGKEVVSNKVLYIDGNEDFDERDNVVFEGRESEIVAIGYFYRAGKVDCKKVYL